MISSVTCHKQWCMSLFKKKLVGSLGWGWVREKWPFLYCMLSPPLAVLFHRIFGYVPLVFYFRLCAKLLLNFICCPTAFPERTFLLQSILTPRHSNFSPFATVSLSTLCFLVSWLLLQTGWSPGLREEGRKPSLAELFWVTVQRLLQASRAFTNFVVFALWDTDGRIYSWLNSKSLGPPLSNISVRSQSHTPTQWLLFTYVRLMTP